MNLRQLTEREFVSDVISKNGEQAVMFSQTTCMPCKVVEGQLSQLEEGKVLKVNLTDTPSLNGTDFSELYGFMGTPTIAIFEDGKVKEMFSGQGQSMRFVAMNM